MNQPRHNEVARVLEDIRARSADTRAAYVARMQAQQCAHPPRKSLSCGNLAHAWAAETDSPARNGNSAIPHFGIVSAYNDVLSAHQPYRHYPQRLRDIAAQIGVSVQVAGGVPAMCDGITQGQPGMDLSLFSRDAIAMGTAVALSHNVFDGVVCLGICDKIVPGLLMGALSFGHLPTIFIPSGPMPSGLSNPEKHAVRQAYAQGKASEEELMAAEQASYHSPGTCTFYGTANSNQVLLEAMGMQLPGTSFIPPETPLRHAATHAAMLRLQQRVVEGVALYQLVDEAAIVNAMVALLASGGSTNHTMHLVAIAACAGIRITWEDFSRLSAVVPLLARVYPNGDADVNQFHAAGGTPVFFAGLLEGGFLCERSTAASGESLADLALQPRASEHALAWQKPLPVSQDSSVLRMPDAPFEASGGLVLLEGNLGRAIMKVSAVKPNQRKVRAPARIFDNQEAVQAAFKAGELNSDVVVVVRFQGPAANGMPELHKLTPALGVLQDQGFAVALVTDGRMSGASGKVPAAIQVCPEAMQGGPLAKLRDGDMITLDAGTGALHCEVDAAEWQQRTRVSSDTYEASMTLGRSLFAPFRAQVSDAETGAISVGTQLPLPKCGAKR